MGTVALLGRTQEPGGFAGGSRTQAIRALPLALTPSRLPRPCGRRAGEPDTDTAGETLRRTAPPSGRDTRDSRHHRPHSGGPAPRAAQRRTPAHGRPRPQEGAGAGSRRSGPPPPPAARAARPSPGPWAQAGPQTGLRAAAQRPPRPRLSPPPARPPPPPPRSPAIAPHSHGAPALRTRRLCTARRPVPVPDHGPAAAARPGPLRDSQRPPPAPRTPRPAGRTRRHAGLTRRARPMASPAPPRPWIPAPRAPPQA